MSTWNLRKKRPKRCYVIRKKKQRLQKLNTMLDNNSKTGLFSKLLQIFQTYNDFSRICVLKFVVNFQVLSFMNLIIFVFQF